MAANGPDEVMTTGADEAECSETTVEIKIKTLDSQTYTLRVDKCVPVPALKEQIAIVTGVLSEQQRLICRGKVLKDDQLLSAYHVEDGHTLHLVVRQPLQSSSSPVMGIVGSESAPSNPADTTSDTSQNRVAHSVVLGTFNIAEQGEGMRDVSRILSAILSSIGLTGSGTEGVGLVRRIMPMIRTRGQLEYVSERHERVHGNGGNEDSPQVQTFHVLPRDSLHDAPRLQPIVSFAPLHPPVIPDSISTLSQYLSHLRHEFIVHGRDRSTDTGASGTGVVEGRESGSGPHSGGGQSPMPTPASLAAVMHSTRHFLIDQVAGGLSQLVRHLEDEATVTDPGDRLNLQSRTMRSGVLLQNLGALLLELGRTTMTLRTGRTPSEAVVNAGPAIFISRSGPNPLMVQPLPFQPGNSFGAPPVGAGQSAGPLGPGLLPRNIDIRIRTGPLMPNSNDNPGEQTVGAQEQPVETGPARVSSVEASGRTATREPRVRVLPVRTVVAAVPAPSNRPTESSNASTGLGLFYPLLARLQQLRGSQPNFSLQTGSLYSPMNVASGVLEMGISANNPASQQQGPLPTYNPSMQEETYAMASGDGPENGGESQAQMSTRFDQLLQTIFPTEQFHVTEDVDFQLSTPITASSAQDHHSDTPREATEAHEEVPRVSDEGLFFSNLLRQIMPLILSQTTTDVATVATDVPGSSASQTEMGNSSNSENSRPRDPPCSPDAKRQKME